MRTYAAYFRVYEPVAAFHEPDRSRWASYADSAARPRRLDALAAEHTAVLNSLITSPPGLVPERESEHAYVRRADGVTYVCPWQTRLRHLLGAGREPDARPHICTSAWTVPLAWFVPFAGQERWVGSRPDRSLLYVTTMALARQRAARCAAALRVVSGSRSADGSRGPLRTHDPDETNSTNSTNNPNSARDTNDPGVPVYTCGPAAAALGCWTMVSSAGWPGRFAEDVTVMRRWLERFHPGSLVELDYGGLVHLFSDAALQADESAAEIGAAVDGAARGHHEVATGMYQRAYVRWQAFSEFEQVN